MEEAEFCLYRWKGGLKATKGRGVTVEYCIYSWRRSIKVTVDRVT